MFTKSETVGERENVLCLSPNGTIQKFIFSLSISIYAELFAKILEKTSKEKLPSR